MELLQLDVQLVLKQPLEHLLDVTDMHLERRREYTNIIQIYKGTPVDRITKNIVN